MDKQEIWQWKRRSVSIGKYTSGIWVRLLTSMLNRLRAGADSRFRKIFRSVLLATNRRVCEFAQRHALHTTWYAVDNTAFCHPLFDDYWERSNLPQGEYELEILLLLDAMKEVPFTFLDCGANCGYWSAIVTSEIMGKHPCTAFEASPIIYRFLKKTALANHNRFTCINAGVSGKSGEKVTFEQNFAHAGSKLTHDANSGSHSVIVETISLTSILAFHTENRSCVVIKLDIEGQEVPTLEGCPELMKHDALIVYEDHGNDEESLVSKHFLQCGWQVYWPEVSDTLVLRLIPIDDTSKLRRFKTNPYRGYNCIAVYPSTTSAWSSIICDLKSATT